ASRRWRSTEHRSLGRTIRRGGTKDAQTNEKNDRESPGHDRRNAGHLFGRNEPDERTAHELGASCRDRRDARHAPFFQDDRPGKERCRSTRRAGDDARHSQMSEPKASEYRGVRGGKISPRVKKIVEVFLLSGGFLMHEMDAVVAKHDLNQHPFYRMWREGT